MHVKLMTFNCALALFLKTPHTHACAFMVTEHKLNNHNHPFKVVISLDLDVNSSLNGTELKIKSVFLDQTEGSASPASCFILWPSTWQMLLGSLASRE